MTDIRTLVESQMALIKNPIIKSGLESILIEPQLHLRNWDYGHEGEQIECWTIAVENSYDTAIVYSDFGFGPRSPWGLVLQSSLWTGMDSSWFDNLEDCFLDSFSAGDLLIWYVERENESNEPEIMEEDLSLDRAYAVRDKLALTDKNYRYHVMPRKKWP